MAVSQTHSLYQLKPLTRTFGVQVRGLDLASTDLTNPELVQHLRTAIIKHRVLLFRNQNLSGARQVEISKLFGEIQSTFYKHPRSPHPDIFRVSNNEQEGCTQVGRSGWHVDGTFQMRPFAYQTMYFESVADGGDTLFVPLNELYESLPVATRETLDRLWMVTGRREAPIHPLVYDHPYRNEKTMVFHCGRPFVNGWLKENADGTVDTSNLTPAETIQNEITQAILDRFDEIGFTMKWQVGDFMINDNLGLAHFASKGTQVNPSKVGLRILHRTTIVGGPETIPKKADGRKSFVLYSE